MRHAFQTWALAVFLGVMAATSPAPAPARSGSAGGSAHTASHGSHRAHHFSRLHKPMFWHGSHHGARHRGHQAAVLGYPFGAWFGWGDGGWPWPPAISAPEPPAIRPEVIVITTDTHGQVHSEMPPDYSYVAGCHAIANGYHCDPSPPAH